MPHDPALPTTAAPVHVGLLVKFDNDAGRHAVVRDDGMRVFVGPIDHLGVISRTMRRFAIGVCTHLGPVRLITIAQDPAGTIKLRSIAGGRAQNANL